MFVWKKAEKTETTLRASRERMRSLYNHYLAKLLFFATVSTELGFNSQAALNAHADAKTSIAALTSLGIGTTYGLTVGQTRRLPGRLLKCVEEYTASQPNDPEIAQKLSNQEIAPVDAITRDRIFGPFTGFRAAVINLGLYCTGAVIEAGMSVNANGAHTLTGVSLAFASVAGARSLTYDVGRFAEHYERELTYAAAFRHDTSELRP